MIRDNFIKFDYERTRLGRYSGITQDMEYTQENLITAYTQWAKCDGSREYLWDTYCDMRDRVPLGTNARIERSRKARPQRILQH